MPSGFGAGLSAVYPGMLEADQLAANQEMHRLQLMAHVQRLQQAQALQPYREARMRQLLTGSPNRGRREYDPSQDLLPTPAGAPAPPSPLPPGAGVASQRASPIPTAPAGVPPSGGSAPPSGTQAPPPPGGGASPFDAGLQSAIQQRDRYRPGSRAFRDWDKIAGRYDTDRRAWKSQNKPEKSGKPGKLSAYAERTQASDAAVRQEIDASRTANEDEALKLIQAGNHKGATEALTKARDAEIKRITKAKISEVLRAQLNTELRDYYGKLLAAVSSPKGTKPVAPAAPAAPPSGQTKSGVSWSIEP